MESTEYKIERWDVLYDERLNIKRPMIYIVPDDYLLEYAKVNIDTLYVTMSGTGIECYDGIQLKAQLFSSANYPNKRPNFFDETGYYVIVLKDAIWVGYPKKLGIVTFQGRVNLVKTEQPTTQPTIQPSSEPTIQATPQPSLEPTTQPSLQPTLEGFSDVLPSLSKSNWILISLGVLFIILFIVRFIINNKKIN